MYGQTLCDVIVQDIVNEMLLSKIIIKLTLKLTRRGNEGRTCVALSKAADHNYLK